MLGILWTRNRNRYYDDKAICDREQAFREEWSNYSITITVTYLFLIAPYRDLGAWELWRIFLAFNCGDGIIMAACLMRGVCRNLKAVATRCDSLFS